MNNSSLSSSKKTVLITGASSGIGLAFAKLFSKNSYNLILVARNKENLCKAQRELSGLGVSVTAITEDLSDYRSPQRLYDRIKKEKLSVEILINNAGFATFGDFSEIDYTREEQEMQVNMVSLTLLTKLFLKDMIKNKSGKILNVSSIAAFQPGPLMAVYYATKAYVLSFSEALSDELKGTGVSITALCPGPTHTNFVNASKMHESKLFKSSYVMSAENVAQCGYKGLMKGKRVVIPGLRNTILSAAARIIPHPLSLVVARKFQEEKRKKLPS